MHDWAGNESGNVRAWRIAEYGIGVASSKESSPSTFEQGAICECVGVDHAPEREGLEYALSRQGPNDGASPGSSRILFVACARVAGSPGEM